MATMHEHAHKIKKERKYPGILMSMLGKYQGLVGNDTYSKYGY